MTDLSGWTARPRPGPVTLAGRYVRLEPLAPVHAAQLFAASDLPDADDRFRWLLSPPPASIDDCRAWIESVAGRDDPMFFAVIDQATGRVAGRQALMRIDPAHGVAEIGNIYWGPLVSRRPAATEALFLTARHVFDDLGYRRFEWKCNDANAPSKRAALRFGFRHEGTFRQHMVVRGRNRDTAWFAMTDGDWPAIRAALTAWLDPANFDADGQQVRPLDACRTGDDQVE